MNNESMRYAVLGVVALALSACGGGGGGSSGSSGGGGNGGGAPAAGTKTYLVAQTFLPGSPNTRSGISLVDPDNPTAEIVIEPPSSNVQDSAMITTGKWDSANRQVTDLHRSHLVYFKDGKIFKLDLRKGASAPVPVQVSSETAACRDLRGGASFGDPNLVRVRYRGADSLAGCGSNEVGKIVDLEMTVAETPRLVPAELITATQSYDVNGVFNGWIAFTQFNAVNFYNVDFGNQTKLADAVDFISRGVTTADGHVVEVNGNLRLYRFSSSTIDPTPIFTTPPGEVPSAWALDGTSVFVLTGPAANPGSPTSVWKASLAGATATKLADLSSVGTAIRITTNQLIFHGQNELFSIAKSDGARKTIASGAINSTIFTKADKVMFEITPVVNNQVGNTRPRVIDENGVLVKDYENYRLFVQTISTTTSFDRSDLPINKVILTNTAGVTSLDLATMGELLLGALPTQTSGSFNGVSIDNFRYGDAGLGFATAGTGPTQLIDLYYADANAAGSLRRITNNIQ